MGRVGPRSLESGALWIERDTVTKTIYAIKNGGDRKAKFLVKHPRQAGTRLHQPPTGTEDNAALGNALLPLEVKPYGKSELTVDERRAYQRQENWLSELAEEAVKAYLGDPRSSRDVVGRLSLAWQTRDALKKLVEERTKLVDEQQELEKMTRETRLSLDAIEKNRQAADLRAKLTKRLADGTSRLEQITKRLIELGMAINEHEVRFRDAIREIKLLSAAPPRA